MTGVEMPPAMQWGFAGFAVLLLGLLAQIVRRLLTAFERNAQVVEANTGVIAILSKGLDDHDQNAKERLEAMAQEVQQLREMLLQQRT